MTKSDFKKFMKCGLGRCYLELSFCEDKEKYREIVLWGCLNNLSYDTQSEGTRAEYLYELASLYRDDGYFVEKIIEKFEKLPAKNDGTFAQLCDLLCCFAGGGNERALAALRNKQKELYSRLLKKRKSGGCDFYLGSYERNSIALTDLGGTGEFIKIATDMGNLTLRNKNYDGSDFEWFYICFENRKGKRALAKLMERESKKSAAVRAFYEGVQWERKLFDNPRGLPATATAEEMIGKVQAGGLERFDSFRFRHRAEEAEKLLLAEAALAEEDLDKKAELLKCFRLDGFPIKLEEIVSYAKSEHEKLREIALEVLGDSRGKAVHDFAIGLMHEKGCISDALNMLIVNYEKEDRQLLLSALDNIKVSYSDESNWHSVVSTILTAFERGVKLPKEALLFIYNRSLCSFCRECAVRRLAKRRWLTAEMREECAHDSNLDIHSFVKAGK